MESFTRVLTAREATLNHEFTNLSTLAKGAVGGGIRENHGGKWVGGRGEVAGWVGSKS